MTDDIETADPAYEPSGRYGEKTSGGHPAIATTIGALLLMGSCAGSVTSKHARAADNVGGEEIIGYLFGGILFGVLLWGVAYLITIRRASPAWKAGSLLIFAFLGLVAALAQIGASLRATNDQVTELAKQMQAFEADPSGGSLNVGPQSPPLVRMFARMQRMIIADRQGFEGEATAVGLPMVTNFEGLTPTSPVLKRCDKVAGLRDRALQYRHRYSDYVAAVREEAAAEGPGGPLSRGQTDDFVKGLEQRRSDMALAWERVGDIATTGAQMCRILARGRWRAGPANEVQFTHDGDLAEMQPHMARIQSIVAAIDADHRAAAAQTRTMIDRQLQPRP